jgi:hypothetical protein
MPTDLAAVDDMAGLRAKAEHAEHDPSPERVFRLFVNQGMGSGVTAGTQPRGANHQLPYSVHVSGAAGLLRPSVAREALALEVWSASIVEGALLRRRVDTTLGRRGEARPAIGCWADGRLVRAEGGRAHRPALVGDACARRDELPKVVAADVGGYGRAARVARHEGGFLFALANERRVGGRSVFLRGSIGCCVRVRVIARIGRTWKRQRWLWWQIDVVRRIGAPFGARAGDAYRDGCTRQNQKREQIASNHGRWDTESEGLRNWLNNFRRRAMLARPITPGKKNHNLVW